MYKTDILAGLAAWQPKFCTKITKVWERFRRSQIEMDRWVDYWLLATERDARAPAAFTERCQCLIFILMSVTTKD